MSSNNNIKITPFVGVSSDPKIEFTGAGNSTITLSVGSSTKGSLEFEGAAGDIFTLTAGVDTDPLFSVTDKFAVPTIEGYPNGDVFIAPYPSYQVGFGLTTLTQSSYKVEIQGGLKVDDTSSGTGKFNTNISHSVITTPTGVLNPVISFPATDGKSYIIHSIHVANVARKQPQGAGATVGINTLAGAVTSVNIDGVGTGYTAGDVFVSMATTDALNRIQGLVGFGTTSFVGVGTTGDPAYAGITSAIGIVTSVSDGAITGVAITYGGFGYTSPPVVIFQSPVVGGGETTETGTSVVTFGEVTNAYLNTPGEGYTDPPTVSIASTTGTGALITADVDSDGKVIRLNLINRGSGYSTLNALGNNEENEVTISQPGLAKTEVGFDILVQRAPVGLAATIDSYLAFDVPLPVGGVVDALKQPLVMKPSDVLKIRGIDVDGSGLDEAVDVHISYEEVNNEDYVGLSTAIGSTIGLGTDVSGTLIRVLENPLLLQSLRLTNTEFVGDYDTSVKLVSDTESRSISTTVSAGSTTLFVGTVPSLVTTNSVVSVGTFFDKAPLVGVGTTAVTIGVGRTSEYSVAAGTGVTFYILGYEEKYLARNIVIPAFASVELLDNAKRIEKYNSIVVETEVVGIDTNIASTMDINLSGKHII
jgi:hypothetical protein